MARWHPYVRSRIEQAQEAIAAGGPNMDVMILELTLHLWHHAGAYTRCGPSSQDMFLAQRAVYYTSGGLSLHYRQTSGAGRCRGARTRQSRRALSHWGGRT